MADPVKKPRVTKAPKVIEKIEVARFALNEAETVKIYKLRDKFNMSFDRPLAGRYLEQKFLVAAAQLRSEAPVKVTHEFKLDTTNILRPVVIVLDFPAPKAPAVRKLKAKVDLPKVAVVRKPKAE